ncbi:MULTISPECIES: folylpolyglutamate synthase/dihydrofolate synthase family protein [Vagococcus]|uniref:Dihydrofolate synthase/folylpolyglutamate synthase n=1 Tax=Vagococcus fluvialis bH819 TaxID=1255619 RepID=A0A1X6WLY9_9ENTE|nr:MULTISPECIES: folylpolyglutamate synthase/dihydrofolate synthase family protein [Vagococcus]SLM85290.1 Dihydrofolate synthase @ Folylpolyglutamate synthase [Vagococcus fluvialis bH819]HCM89414.1 bifunctional folylpolyglutamate synthase/dihydrofolate synthase [Vagococcus sp.]
MNYEETVAWIHDRIKFGIRPGLIRIDELLNRLDNPQHKLKTVHIGGTNGKGSTTTFLRCLLEEQGLKVGTFTSPYIETFNERIAINGKPIPDEELVRLVTKIKPLVDDMDTVEDLKNAVEFEILTAIMFQYFLDSEVDIVIVEVGLGGRYDCTNVITPLASAITTIGLDHIDILGETIEEIAAQKAGIIKQDVPVVVGRVEEVAFEVIEKEANTLNSPIYRYEEDFSSKYIQPDDNWGEIFSYRSQTLDLSHMTISLLGKHQVDNASVAIQLYDVVSTKLGLPVSGKEIKKGLKKAFWPGRMEKISDEPLIVLDGAHNEHAMEVLVNNLKTEFKGSHIHTIFGALSTKDIDSMIRDLKTVPNLDLKVTAFDYPKAFTKEQYSEMGLNAYDKWQEALAISLEELTGDDVILITGSLYFISQVREILLGGN